MSFLERLSIRGKIRFIVLAVSIAALAMIVILSSLNDWDSAKREAGENLSVFARVIADNLVAAVLFSDAESAGKVLSSLEMNPVIVRAVLYLPEGEVFAEYRREGIDDLPFLPMSSENGFVFKKGYLCITEPVVDGDNTLGRLFMVSDLNWLYLRLSWNSLFKFFILLLAVGLSYILSGLLHRIVTEPITRLTSVMRRITETGEYRELIQRESSDEVGALVDGFNKMIVAIRKREEMLQKEIEERRRVEEMLRERESAYRTLARNLPGIVYRVNLGKEAGMMFFNDQLEAITGFTEAELRRGEICMIDPLILPEDRKRVTQTVRSAIRRKVPFEVEYRLRHKNGEIRHLLERGRPVYDPDGSPMYIDGVILDITDKVKLQNDAIRASHLASLGELSAGVAHEINNPINGIINFGEMIMMDSEKGSALHDLGERIVREGERVSKIVKSLLSFARHQAGEMQETDIGNVLAEALNLYGAQIRKDGIILKVDIPEGLPLIRGNAQQLMQVFLNLLSNARYALNRKFTSPQAGKVIRVSASVENLGERKYLKVQFFDNGVGIPAERIERVIEPFYTTKPAGVGTGLGLSISHGIILEHEGRLEIESSEGEYTNITILFPVIV
jgi:PAS domain S-box-containing protein